MFSSQGNVIFSNMRAVREFIAVIHKTSGWSTHGLAAIQPGELYALGLLDEIFHIIIHTYMDHYGQNTYSTLAETIIGETSVQHLRGSLMDFCGTFPPVEVYHSPGILNDYLSAETNGMKNKYAALEEMILLWITNRNPAAMKYEELFNENLLSAPDQYVKVIDLIREFFIKKPGFGPDNLDLISFLLQPISVSPNSIFGQLEYIRNNWGQYLGNLMSKLLSNMDLLQEEAKTFHTGNQSPGPIVVPNYRNIADSATPELERFSPDQDWMPSVVMMAKNSYVWLYQLSKKYNRKITHLDEIPDEELDFLSNAGFSGLWLIGLWERSKASERIKKLCGNPEAVASAYSIHSYQIASDLGGELAFTNLRDRAWQRGIRMASDMVPNHFGIESDWVLYQPDKFLSLDYCPFPSYTFNGENLSPDPAIGIYLEDHYYTRTDAAVVFKRVDFHTGDIRYIYHGNDGTVMPWNDTAQLNYLKSDVREAIIQIILDVARRTPIIRFDAAMTLAKKHIQRLWFPEPGTGGAIPSRSEHSLTRVEFDRLIPEEFWREVVDRVAREVPDTLLLAEAFWLMEGYFVRSLGMHRVYNSAFMHMLRNEDNANFRKLIKNTLEFDPEILKRYVNFMNNPDEKTAVEQFGNGDKYFGVCTVLATLPGLPMFGHGQLEGYSEKYGMEYRRAYLDEQINEGLVNHHHKIIFPLLRQRAKFSGAENFRLFDFFTQPGIINEDVIAYTNNLHGQRSLVLYHNKYQQTKGWINHSASYLNKQSGSTQLQTESIAQTLGCSGLPGHYLLFQEFATGLTYILDSEQVARDGLYFELSAYGHRVFQEFFEVVDTAQTSYGELCKTLAGRGVEDLNRELHKKRIHALYLSLCALTQPDVLEQFALSLQSGFLAIDHFILKYRKDLENLAWHFHELNPGNHSGIDFVSDLERSMISLSEILRLTNTLPQHSNGWKIAKLFDLKSTDETTLAIWLKIIADSIQKSTHFVISSLPDYYEDWMIATLLREDQKTLNIAFWLFITPPQAVDLADNPASCFKLIIEDPHFIRALGINHSDDTLWFNQEAMQSWLTVMPICLLLSLLSDQRIDAGVKLESTQKIFSLIQQLQEAYKNSRCQVKEMLRLLQRENRPKKLNRIADRPRHSDNNQ